MTTQPDHLDELQRMLRVANQSITAHSILRDRFNARALLTDILILVSSAIVAVGTFTGDDILRMLMVGSESPKIILGLIAVGVFVLSLVQFKVGWKEKASAHAEAVKALSQVKAEIRRMLSSTSQITTHHFEVLAALYDTTNGNMVSIPESHFVSLKARHKRKVRISKILDRLPHASLPLLRLRLWWRDTIGAKYADDV